MRTQLRPEREGLIRSNSNLAHEWDVPRLFDANLVIANAEQVAAGGDPIPEAAARGGKAGMASRTNTLFSIPMLFFMISAANLPGFLSGTNDMMYWLVAGGVIVAVEINGLIGPGAATQKPLTSVSGTIHGGLALWLVLYLIGALLNS